MCEHSHENNIRTILIIITAVILLCVAQLLPLNEVIKFYVFLAAYILSGGEVLFKAVKNIFRGDLFDENFLMGLATLGAFCIKEYPEAVMVMILYQFGEYLQDCALDKSHKSITKLMDIRPDYANIEKNGEIIKVLPDKLSLGDIIIVKSGEKIPLDGTVVDGTAVLDTSALTGEAAPKIIKTGDYALSGCINTNGVLKIKVEKEFKDCTVTTILDLVEQAEHKKAKVQNFITRFAKIYTPFVVIIAVLLATVPIFFTETAFDFWFSKALTFLVISCPCALVISVPLSFYAGIGGASKHGILIKGSCYLEAMSKPYAVAFDKTGTLTKGIFEVREIKPQPGISKKELLKAASAAETYSIHPIAKSIKKVCGLSDLSAETVEIAGCGVKAIIKGSTILAGSKKLMEQFKIKTENIPGTVVYIAKDDKYLGYITISDTLKCNSYDAITKLKELGVLTVMLTGDNRESTVQIQNELMLDRIYSELMPKDKVSSIEKLILEKPHNKTVIFAGDGINDAPVLTRADVGIAMGALGSDAAVEAADVVITDDNTAKIPLAVKISQKTLQIVKQNIIFALGIKGLFLILTAAGYMTMWGAVFADVGVTFITVLNSLRALKINPSR